MRICVISDIEKLPALVSTWNSYLDTAHHKSPSSERLLPLLKIRDRLTTRAQNPGQKGGPPSSIIVPMSTTDTSFLTAVTKGPTSRTDPAHVAIEIANAFLDAVEGPLWVAIRGTGLAYSAWLTSSCESGQLSLKIYRSPSAHKALAAAKRVVEGYIDGTTPIDAELVSPASVSAIVGDFASDHATMATAVRSSLEDAVVNNVPAGYQEHLLKQAKQFTVEDLKKALKEHILPLFSGETADVFATCPSSVSAAEELRSRLREMGFEPDIQPLKHFEGGFNAIPEEDGNDDEHGSD